MPKAYEEAGVSVEAGYVLGNIVKKTDSDVELQ